MFAASKSGSAVEATDAQFNYVTMLLHGDGTNGAQNNTFVDSSTNNFTITRNGNTTQGTFTPYGANWSNYFDGTGDYLTTPSSADFGFSTGDFTVECWVFPLSSAAQRLVFFSNDMNNLDIGFNPANTFQYYNGSVIDTGISAATKQWFHFAASRTSGTTSVYVNGVRTNNVSDTSSTTSRSVSVGSSSGSNSFNGYISNVRIIKGTGIYSGTTITLPTAPFTAVTNTKLLTCADNRFIDDSTNNFTITKNGDVSVQRFSPFSPTTAYSTSVIGGSGYFDGSGDYLTVADNAALDFAADFTFECWVYSAASNNSSIFEGYQSGFSLGFDGGTIKVNQSYVAVLLSDTAVMQLNSWHHIAVSRSGTTLSLFMDGVRTATATNSTSFNTNTLNYIGQNGSSVYFSGYISNLRVVKGTAVYDPTQTTLTVPTAPLTAITNTSLLLSYTNAGILDNAMMNNLETVGNAQISTSVKKYGTGSLAFDGTGDYLIPNSASSNLVLGLGSGDFTVEFWVYFNSGLGSDIVLYDGRPLSTNGAYPTLYVNSSSQLSYVVSSADRITSASAFSTSTWYHIAVARSGTSTKMFVNGTQVGSTYTDSTNYLSASRRPTIGINGFNETAAALNGYIDDLRISKVARYTANFTAPTAAFADKG